MPRPIPSILLLLPLLPATGNPLPPTTEERILERNGISVEEGIEEILAYLETSPPPPESIEDWIDRLGNPDYAVREEAMSRLERTGFIAREALLNRRSTTTDPEIRERCRVLLDRTAPLDPPSIVRGACVTMLRERGTPELLERLARIQVGEPNGPIRRRMEGILACWTSAERIDAVVTILKDDDPRLRGLGARLLTYVPTTNAVERLLACSDDPDPEVRLHAAVALLTHERPEGIRLLGGLDADDVPSGIREAATGYLDRVLPHGSEAAWPLPSLHDELVVVRWEAATDHRIAAFDVDGRTRRIGSDREMAAVPAFHTEDRLPRGGTVEIRNGGTIVERTGSGNDRTWLADLSGASFIRVLPQGHLLTGSGIARSVREYDPSGRCVWECLLPTAPRDALRTSDGWTWVISGNELLRIDRAGIVRNRPLTRWGDIRKIRFVERGER